MKVYAMVNTEGDAGMDAALNDIGMWKESFLSVRLCSGYGCLVNIAGQSAYDDGLCGACRDISDAMLRSDQREGNRLCARVRSLFPDMSAGQVMAMASNIMAFEKLVQ